MKKDRADPKNGQCDDQRPDGAQQCTQGIWFEISDPPFRAACIFTAGDSPMTVTLLNEMWDRACLLYTSDAADE